MSTSSREARNTEASFFKGAHHTDASHGQFTSVGRDQITTVHNVHIYSAEQESALTALNPVDRKGYYVQPCMPDTRRWIIEEIHSWLDDNQAPNILWLSGSPGAGKSTIASTLISSLEESGRLGSYFFCKRSDVALSDPTAFWRTVAFDLARRDSAIAERLVENLKAGKVDPGRANIESHFKYLIEDPLLESWRRHTAAGHEESKADRDKFFTRLPVVVLDALDECGSDSSQSAQRRNLMNTITSWSRLHPSFKLFITSRDERITPSFRDACRHIPLETGELVSSKARYDVQIFFERRFADIAVNYPSLPPSWPGMSIIEELTDRAAGLFILADTVVRFLEEGFPEEQLHLILDGAFHEEGDAIDVLYRQILQLSLGNSKGRVLDTFKRVMGAIVLAKTPLRRDDLKHFLEEDETAIDFILQKLSSVLQARNVDGRVHISHLSFAEFVCDSNRCDKAFVVDRSTHSHMMVLACLRAMKIGLRFNICQLETSYVRNNDVSDLASRIDKAIPTHLSYACHFWADHLLATAFEVEIVKELSDFLHTRLLYWLEVLSLMKEGRVASQALLSACEWSRAQDEDVVAFATDARKFVAAFASVISQSAPHIYLSALPFAPRESIVSKVFLPHFPQTLSVEIGKATSWPAIQNVLEGHTSRVHSIAFSPDGKRIVSGSHDQTIRVWDAETGDIVSGPFEGHTYSVNSVAFSPDGKPIVSGFDDTTIWVWDAETGDIVSGPLKGYTDSVCSVAFSPDGKRIVSGSYDSTIRVWDAETGDIVSGQFGGQFCAVRSVAFSPDGKRIVSGSSDHMIRVWDAETGDIISGPFGGHTDWVDSIVFSPDGKRIASGSWDNTLRVWDAETGDIVSKGHSSQINSVMFSPDGKRIVSGSSDHMIRVWDAETGHIIAGPFEGHTEPVSSAVFSPDGKRIASGSSDNTIRVWDAETDDIVSRPFEGHTHRVNSVAFSPDGKRIVSGSYDNTIRVWDAETGDIVSKGHSGPINSVMFSPDGKRIASGSDDHTIRVWDAETGDIVSGPFEAHPCVVRSIAFSPDGKRIVSGSDDHRIWVWDAETGDIVSGPFERHTSPVGSVMFSPDGKRIVSGSDDTTIRVWDAETGDIVSGPFEGHTSSVTSVAFSPDGKRIVSSSDDTTIRVWDAETGDLVSGQFEGHTSAVNSVVFSPDGKCIVSGSDDTTIRVWDAEMGDIVSRPFEGHTRRVKSVAFSPDGKRVVSGSYDNTIRMWDAETGNIFSGPFTGPTSMVQSSVDKISYGNDKVQEASPGALRDDSKLENGWMLSSHLELLFWVPPLHRAVLWRSRNTAVIGKLSTKLDLGKFVHGDSWQQCQSSRPKNPNELVGIMPLLSPGSGPPEVKDSGVSLTANRRLVG